MRQMFIIALPLTTTFLPAFAADPNLIIGKWIEKFPNGNGLVTEFTKSSISTYPVDQSGNSTGAIGKNDVTYRELGQTSVGVDFQGGGGIMVIVESPDSIVLDFPGMGAHRLHRVHP